MLYTLGKVEIDLFPWKSNGLGWNLKEVANEESKQNAIDLASAGSKQPRRRDCCKCFCRTGALDRRTASQAGFEDFSVGTSEVRLCVFSQTILASRQHAIAGSNGCDVDYSRIETGEWMVTQLQSRWKVERSELDFEKADAVRSDHLRLRCAPC